MTVEEYIGKIEWIFFRVVVALLLMLLALALLVFGSVHFVEFIRRLIA